MGEVSIVIGPEVLFPLYAASLAAIVSAIRSPLGKRCTIPGSSTWMGSDVSAIRTGEMTRCDSTIVPSGFRSYSLKNSTSSAGAPPATDAAWNVGADRFTSAVGTPITSRPLDSGADVNSAKVPGASVTGVSWSIAEVSVKLVGPPAVGVLNDAVPAATLLRAPTSASDPDR